VFSKYKDMSDCCSVSAVLASSTNVTSYLLTYLLKVANLEIVADHSPPSNRSAARVQDTGVTSAAGK